MYRRFLQTNTKGWGKGTQKGLGFFKRQKEVTSSLEREKRSEGKKISGRGTEKFKFPT